MIRVITLEQLRVKEGSTGARACVTSAVTWGQCEGRRWGRRSRRALSGENIDRHLWAKRPGKAGKRWALGGLAEDHSRLSMEGKDGGWKDV